VRYLNASGTVTSCVVRIIVVLSTCVVRRIFETKERETGVYATRIAS